MPFPIAAKAGVIALSVAVAAAIAVYESPEVRRLADDLRRRIAIALQSLGDNIAPHDTENQQNREPVFNRPEDAEGFLMSRGAVGGEAGVVADEASRRRQREELMYWNSMLLEKKEKEQREALEEVEKATRAAAEAAGLPVATLAMTSFDQMLRHDGSADKGTYVVNTGADVRGSSNNNNSDDLFNGGLVRRRRPEGVRGLHSSVYVDPFSDEYGIEMDEQREHQLSASGLAPEADEVSDIYNATEPDTSAPMPAAAAAAAASRSMNMEAVFDALPEDLSRAATVSPFPTSEVFFDATNATATASPARSLLLERTLDDAEFMTASQGGRTREATTDDEEDGDHLNDAFSSIQAWAQNSSNTGFYSPLPVTPSAPLSEPEVISTGELTPTDSMSILGDADTLAASAMESTTILTTPDNNEDDKASRSSATAGRYYDVLSESEDGDGLMTPTSWTEVGSVLSESDAGVAARGARPGLD